MTVDYLLNLLKGCEYLDDFVIAVGFLDEKNNSVSIVPDGDDEVVRKYCDGAKIKEYGFSLIIRLGANFGDNSKNLDFLEKLTDWLSSIRLSDDFLHIPLGIVINKGPKLKEDKIHSLKYEINCRFFYLQE